MKKFKQIETEEFLQTMLIVQSAIGNSNVNDINNLFQEYKELKFDLKPKAIRDSNGNIVKITNKTLKNHPLFKNRTVIKIKPKKAFTEEFQNLNAKDLINLLK